MRKRTGKQLGPLVALLEAQLSQTQTLVDRLYKDINKYRDGLREIRDTAFSLNSDRWKAIRCSEIAHYLLKKEV